MTKKYLITSALPYINGIKHLGNLIGSILPADVYARYLRQCGKEVLYICGTDDHGTPAEIAAHEKGMAIEDFCAQMYELQRENYEQFGIQFDYFGRSSAPSNHKFTQELFLAMWERGYVEERVIEQYYSPVDGRYLPDRYVEGTCPHCGFAKARGDQCDGCGTLLDPTDLIEPYSSLSGSRDIHLQKTKHLFLLLEKLSGDLENWTEGQSQWPDVVKGIVKKWLKEGLHARCITRDLSWGVPVPLPGYEGKVFYVWFDAPNAYVSITQDWAQIQGKPDAWKDWWLPATKTDVHYTQFMAKDNVAFHAIFWPGMLMASGQNWKMVDYLKGLNWLTYDKGKFSTSNKRGIFADTALELYPADYWRYYLLAHSPESSDSDFTFSHFASVINKDLADILGNFANRSFSLIHKYFEGKVPVQLDYSTIDADLHQRAAELVEKVQESLEHVKFRQAAGYLRSLWVLGNEYITEQKPWETIKTDKDKAAICLTHCVYLLRLSALCSYPFLPYTTKQILELLNNPMTESSSLPQMRDGLDFKKFDPNHELHPPLRLFTKIEDEAVTELTKRYGGEGAGS